MFGTGTLDGFKGAVNRWLLPGVVSFLQFYIARVLVWLQKQFINNFFSYLGQCSGFINNNNNNISNNMTFMQEIFYQFKKIFGDIEKATKKCVHFNAGIEFSKTCLTSDLP